MLEQASFIEWIKWALLLIFGSGGIGGIIGYLIRRKIEELDRRRNHDKETLRELTDVMTTDNMFTIRDQDFGGAYPRDIHVMMNRFIEFCSDPQYFFLDNSLKKIQCRLIKAIKEFLNKLAIKTGRSGHPDFYSIPQPHEFDNRSEYEQYRNELNQMADAIWKTYTALIVASKKKL